MTLVSADSGPRPRGADHALHGQLHGLGRARLAVAGALRKQAAPLLKMVSGNIQFSA
jgi:hypothetical protein